MVKAGRMMAGRPILGSASMHSAMVEAMVAAGFSSPMRSMASRNSLRSSAISMAARLAPISSTSYFASTPASSSARAAFSAVWPPIVGRIASGRSASMILVIASTVIGSI